MCKSRTLVPRAIRDRGFERSATRGAEARHEPLELGVIEAVTSGNVWHRIPPEDREHGGLCPRHHPGTRAGCARAIAAAAVER